LNNNTKISLMSLLLALSALHSPAGNATPPPTQLSPQERAARIIAALQERIADKPESVKISTDILARGWGKTSRGGFVNSGRGGFLNSRPWRNGWFDGGGFLNRRPWRNGGFLNRW
jgi:rSAM-associated Gly-rich repeat protein